MAKKCAKQGEKRYSNQKSNQFYLSSIAWGVVAQSPEPGAHVLNARAFRIELEFRNVGFCGEGKTGVPGEKPLGAKKRTNNKLNPHMTSSPGIEPGPHWWKASALTTAPSLLLPVFVKSSSTFWNKICTWYAFYGPKIRQTCFAASDVTHVYDVTSALFYPIRS